MSIPWTNWNRSTERMHSRSTSETPWCSPRTHLNLHVKKTIEFLISKMGLGSKLLEKMDGFQINKMISGLWDVLTSQEAYIARPIEGPPGPESCRSYGQFQVQNKTLRAQPVSAPWRHTGWLQCFKNFKNQHQATYIHHIQYDSDMILIWALNYSRIAQKPTQLTDAHRSCHSNRWQSWQGAPGRTSLTILGNSARWGDGAMGLPGWSSGKGEQSK